MATTSVLHNEMFSSTQSLGAISGFFIPIFPKNTDITNNQICINNKSRLSFYTINEVQKKLFSLLKYKVYGKISAINKYHSLLPNVDTNSIVLAIDESKISFIQYNMNCDDFQTICLYGLDSTLLSGKMFSPQTFEIFSSLKKNFLLFKFDDNKINVLRSLPNLPQEPQQNVNEKYYDTINGEKYFCPSSVISFFDKKFKFVYKIIKVFIQGEEPYSLSNAQYGYTDSNEISFFILYEDSGIEGNILHFTKSKKNIAQIKYNIVKNEICSFDIKYENVDENAFDFFIIEDPIQHLTKIIVFSAYEIQIIFIESNINLTVLLNKIYHTFFTKNYYEKNPKLYNLDLRYLDYSLDLRGGSYLIVSQDGFMFTSSDGQIFFLTFSQMEYKIDSLKVQLGAPYNTLLMPLLGVFFCSSPFADTVVISFSNNNSVESYDIVDSIPNYSPVVNFHLINDNKKMKYVFTSGYGKCGKINFAYDKFVYYEIQKNFDTTFDYSFMKSIRLDEDIYTRYLICGMKSGVCVVFENNGKDFESINDRITIGRDGHVLTCGVVKIENLNTTSFIVIVTTTDVQVFTPLMEHVSSIKAKDIFGSTTVSIQKFALGTNCLIVSNDSNSSMVILSFHSYTNGIINNYPMGGSYSEKKLNKAVLMRYRRISDIIQTDTIIKYNINTKLYLGCYTMILFYRSDQSIEIFDLNTLLISTVAPFPLLKTGLLNEMPQILSNDINDYYKSLSDTSVKINVDVKVTNVTSLETPETLFLDVLSQKCLLCVLFKNGTVVVYQMFHSNVTAAGFSISFKKIYIEYLQELNYKEFFMLESSNIFIKFNNLFGHSGVLININGNQKIIFDINDEIVIMSFNNSYIKHNYTFFVEYSNEEIENGFLINENGQIKHCYIPKNYKIGYNGMLIRSNNLNRFPVTLNYFPFWYQMMFYYCYFLVEKEFIKETNKFKYFLTFRTEDAKSEDEVVFGDNEMITESRVVDLPQLPSATNPTGTGKFVAIGVNVFDPVKGESGPFKARLQLYDRADKKFNKIYDGEMFKGTISMIYSIDKILLLGEGNRIYLYQYLPTTKELKKISYIDNKNLIACSKLQSKQLLTGDILESGSWMVFSPQIQANPPSLITICKDNSNYHSTAIEFWSDKSDNDRERYGCILCDDLGNGHVFILVEGKNIQLAEICDFNLGKVIYEIRLGLQRGKDGNAYYYSADDGSFGCFVFMKSEAFKKLSQLCDFLYSHMPYRAGCNPKSFYAVKNFPLKKPKENFIDMSLLKAYIYMPISMQSVIAQKCSSERDKIIKYINDLIV